MHEVAETNLESESESEMSFLLIDKLLPGTSYIAGTAHVIIILNIYDPRHVLTYN